MKHLFAKWAVTFGQMENMYTIMIIPPPSSVYSSAKKLIWSPLSRVQQPLVLCSAKIGVFSRKLIENVFTLIRKLAAGAIIASTTELAVIVINCIGHNMKAH